MTVIILILRSNSFKKLLKINCNEQVNKHLFNEIDAPANQH